MVVTKEIELAEEFVETKFIESHIDYTGEELRSHFVRDISGIELDGVVSFIGGCNVSGSSLVDMEDFEKGDYIKAEKMLHFIGEHFSVPLREGNYRLRLFASIVCDRVGEMCGCRVKRIGDDLFVGERKLSVAICTVSPVSVLFHFGINIDPSGAPVDAVGLHELGISPRSLAESVLDAYSTECRDVEYAIRKVRGVG